MGWGNGEYEYYTNAPKNIRTENGNLIIEVQVETGNVSWKSDANQYSDHTSMKEF